MLVVLALVGGGFWVLATYGKKVVTAPVESIIQPPWIKEAVAYAPEPAAAAKAAVPTERETVLADQLTALQAGSQDAAGGPGGAQAAARHTAHPGTEGGARRCGTGEGVRVDAPYLARPEGGDGRTQGE